MLPSSSMVCEAWPFLQGYSSGPGPLRQNIINISRHTSFIEDDMSALESRLAEPGLHFRSQYQVLAPGFEGKISPAKMAELVLDICFTHKLYKAYGAKTTALSTKSFARRLPTPGPHANANDFNPSVIQRTLQRNIQDVEASKSIRDSLFQKREQQDHLVLAYDATITPTGIILRGP